MDWEPLRIDHLDHHEAEREHGQAGDEDGHGRCTERVPGDERSDEAHCHDGRDHGIRLSGDQEKGRGWHWRGSGNHMLHDITGAFERYR